MLEMVIFIVSSVVRMRPELDMQMTMVWSVGLLKR